MGTTQTFRIDNEDPNTSAAQRYQFLEINRADYTNINYDFWISVHASTEQTPEKLEQDAMQAMQLQMQFQPAVPLITNEEFIQAMNWSDTFKETILNRLKEDNINNQKNKVLDIMALAVNATDPENELHGISTEDLVQAGLQILRPEPQKLGNVGDIQGAQESAPKQTYSPISPVT